MERGPKMDYSFDKAAVELYTEFMKLSERGWIKSNRFHNTGIGKTLEDLLDKEEDNNQLPDYKGIELKAHRSMSNSYITLFTSSPDGPNKAENTRLRETYGEAEEVSGLKTLHTSIFATRKTSYFNKYFFQLDVSRADEKVYLLVFDKNERLIEKITFWSFSNLSTRINKKLKNLAVIKSKNKITNGEEYFYYEEISLYRFTNFNNFLDALEDGRIMLDIRIGVYRSGTNMGKTHDHGTGFRIKETDLTSIYDEYHVHSYENKR